MLRISKITDYGTLIMAHMTGQPEHLYSAAELADRLGLGLPTVSKVLKALARHRLVTGLRGAHGGYRLARPARAVSLADIIDALEEQPFGLTECSATSGLCSLENGCRVRVNWMHINTVIRRALEDVSLADMVESAPFPGNVRPLRGPDHRAKQPIS